MRFSVDGITIDDFLELEWRDVVAGVEERDCTHYNGAFYKKSEEAEQAGNDKKASLFLLLSDLSSMKIDVEDQAFPLKPLMDNQQGRTAILSDFAPTVGLLSEVLPHIDDDELLARIADVVWLSKRDFRAARIAVTAYLKVADLSDHKQWRRTTERMIRAIAIASQANQRELVTEAIRRIEETLATFNGTEASFLPLRLMRMLQVRRKGDTTKYAALAASLAMVAERQHEWNRARDYWVAQAEWFKISNAPDQEKLALVRSAETYVQEAELRTIPHGDRSYIAASELVERAIYALRQLGGQKDRIAELHPILLDYQEKANAEMQVFSHNWDASKMITAATEQIAGKTLYDALFALALIAWPPQITTLRKQAEFKRQGFMSMSDLIGTTRFTNARGRTIARRDPPEASEDEQEADLRIEMYDVANLSRELQVKGSIIPAAAQILREHTVSEDDLWAIVRDNPFIPRGREKFYLRGLQAGFREDWVTVVHLLVPQIENSVRHVLEGMGVITSGLDDDGIQDERDLNRTLRLPEFAGPMKRVFGEDLVFDLRGLLIERYGANLRNRVAHGLIDYHSFSSVPCIYLWWQTLHILCLPKLGPELEGAVTDGERNDGGSETAPESGSEA